MLNGFELHVYNRCDLYAQLEKTFGLPPEIFLDETHTTNTDEREPETKKKKKKRNKPASTTIDVSKHVDNIRKKEAYVIARTWRDLIPVIKVDVCTVSIQLSIHLIQTIVIKVL